MMNDVLKRTGGRWRTGMGDNRQKVTMFLNLLEESGVDALRCGPPSLAISV